MTDIDTGDFDAAALATLEYDVHRSSGETVLSPPDPDDTTADEWECHYQFAKILGENDVPLEPEIGDFVGIRLRPAFEDTFAPSETVDGIDVFTRTAPIVMEALEDAFETLWEMFGQHLRELSDAVNDSESGEQTDE